MRHFDRLSGLLALVAGVAMAPAAACVIGNGSDDCSAFPDSTRCGGGGGGTSSPSSSASGGASTATSSGGCSSKPTPPGGACPAVCNGGCPEAGVCEINCTSSACEGSTIQCPPGFSCNVFCMGSCQDATIQCPDTYPCSVECLDSSSPGCQGMIVKCSATGVCGIVCSPGTACQGATVQCGGAACSAICTPGPERADRRLRQLLLLHELLMQGAWRRARRRARTVRMTHLRRVGPGVLVAALAGCGAPGAAGVRPPEDRVAAPAPMADRPAAPPLSASPSATAAAEAAPGGSWSNPLAAILGLDDVPDGFFDGHLDTQLPHALAVAA